MSTTDAHTIQMRVDLPKHCAKETALAYFGSRSDGKLEVPTYNNTTPYI